MSEDNASLQDEIRQRYWGSDESVNGIAADLGISKGRFYDLIPILRVEGACPACRVPGPGYANRTARDQGELTCVLCGWTGSESELAPLEEGTEATASLREQPAALGAPHHAVRGGGPRREPLPTGALDPTSVIGGALVGLAAGLLLGGWLRR